jgi:two-component system chemotaxis response regulator CheB
MTGTRSNGTIGNKKGKDVSVRRPKGLERTVKKNNSKLYYVACVGASAGGLNAVTELVNKFPSKLNAAVFIVLHLSRAGFSEILIEKIKKGSPMPCYIARNGETIMPGSIYLAPADRHLLIRKNKIVIGDGPPENRFRPSIDVLFRSAAAHYGERAVGIILTGLLNDGSAGMWAIRESGGHCIVQDPNEAEYPDMPVSVLETMEVDHVASLRKIGGILRNIIERNEIKGIKPSLMTIAESNLSEKVATAIEDVQKLGEKSFYSCPDCGGNLWKLEKGKIAHYRCHIGHSYSQQDLILKQKENIEQTIWVAIRMMEERKLLLLRMAGEHKGKGLDNLSGNYREQAERLEGHIDKLKDLLFMNHKQKVQRAN